MPQDMDEILKTPEEENVSRFYREVQIKDALFGENIEFVPQYDVARIRAFDITEQKRAEKALRKSQASLAEAQRLAHLGNWEWHIRERESSGPMRFTASWGSPPEDLAPPSRPI